MKNETMKFNADGKFTIMIVGDPHEKPRYSSAKDNARYLDYVRLQNTALDKINPDLVVIMGDVVNAEDEETLDFALKTTLAPFINRNIPFTVVKGNHDGQSGATWEMHEKVYRSIDNCLYCPDVTQSDNRGDYNIMLRSSDGRRDIFNLWFMNSGSDSPDGIGYDYVRAEQIQWYENRCNEITESNNGKIVPSFVFQHIPVCEEYKLLKESTWFSTLFGGILDDNEENRKFYMPDKKHFIKGYLGEGPSTPEYNSGQFESWKKQGDVIGAFFGHDHISDFIGKYEGIYMAQCKLGGFGAYGDGLHQGVRVVTLDENNPKSFRTDMRYYRDLIGMSCMSIHGRVKYVHDKTGIKIDFAERVLGIGALAAVGIAAVRKLIK